MVLDGETVALSVVATRDTVIPGMNAIAFTREERALARVSKDGVQLGDCGHPSRLAEDGEHLRMTNSPAANRDLKTIRPRAA